MPDNIWINGIVHPADRPVLSGLNRGFLLGEGVFETMAVINGRIWKLERHISRLQLGLDGLQIPLFMTPDRAQGILNDLLLTSENQNGVLRLTISSGDGGRGLVTNPGIAPTISAFIDPLPGQQRGPATAFIASTRRNHLTAASKWKIIPYVDNMMATREALAYGATEALMLNAADQLCCFSTGNLLVWDGDTLFTPDLASGALPGTTLDLLLMAPGSALPIQQKVLDGSDLDRMKGLYKLNSLTGILPISSLNNRPLQSEAMPELKTIREILKTDVIVSCGPLDSDVTFPWLQD